MVSRPGAARGRCPGALEPDDRASGEGPARAARSPVASARAMPRAEAAERVAVWPAIAVGLLALLLDWRALLPTVGLWDTAEFQAIGPVLGIAHPTGYPSYTLLAWVASVVLQPFGDEAYRANLLSAILAAGGIGLTAHAVVLLTRRPIAGLAAGAALAVSPLAWSIGLRADAHALHVALVGLLLVLVVSWMRAHRAGGAADRWLLAASVAFGVSLGNHALTILLAPGIALAVLLTAPRLPVRRPGLVAACAALIAVTTVALYLYLPLRSAMNPPLDYADPQTWERFRYVVFGEQFRGTFHAYPAIPEILRTLREVTLDQLGPMALAALVGAIALLVRRPAVFALAAAWFCVPFAFALGYENAQIERYYLVPLVVTALLAGVGLSALWSLALQAWGQLLRRSLAAWMAENGRPGRELLSTPAARAVGAAALAVVLLAPSAAALPANLRAVDSSADRSGREWLDATFRALPPDAVVISWWGFSTTLWYGQFVEGSRTDLAVFDDRTILDRNLGGVSGVIDRYLGRTPVYVIRHADEIAALSRRYRLTALDGVPAWGRIWLVEPDPRQSPF